MADNQAGNGSQDQGEADVISGQLGSPAVRATGRPGASSGREPIFNQMPIGVAIVVALILFGHVAAMSVGPAMYDALLAVYALTPSLLSQDTSSGDWLSAFKMLIGHQFLHGGTIHLVMNLAAAIAMPQHVLSSSLSYAELAGA